MAKVASFVICVVRESLKWKQCLKICFVIISWYIFLRYLIPSLGQRSFCGASQSYFLFGAVFSTSFFPPLSRLGANWWKEATSGISRLGISWICSRNKESQREWLSDAVLQLSPILQREKYQLHISRFFSPSERNTRRGKELLVNSLLPEDVFFPTVAHTYFPITSRSRSEQRKKGKRKKKLNKCRCLSCTPDHRQFDPTSVHILNMFFFACFFFHVMHSFHLHRGKIYPGIAMRLHSMEHHNNATKTPRIFSTHELPRFRFLPETCCFYCGREETQLKKKLRWAGTKKQRTMEQSADWDQEFKYCAQDFIPREVLLFWKNTARVDTTNTFLYIHFHITITRLPDISWIFNRFHACFEKYKNKGCRLLSTLYPGKGGLKQWFYKSCSSSFSFGEKART